MFVHTYMYNIIYHFLLLTFKLYRVGRQFRKIFHEFNLINGKYYGIVINSCKLDPKIPHRQSETSYITPDLCFISEWFHSGSSSCRAPPRALLLRNGLRALHRNQHESPDVRLIPSLRPLRLFPGSVPKPANHGVLRRLLPLLRPETHSSGCGHDE